MIISVWRYSHLGLAVSSFILLTIAAVTGIILALEPLADKAQGYKTDGFDTVTLSTIVPIVKAKYKGIQTLSVDDNNYVTITYTNKDDRNEQLYINPLTADTLGTLKKKTAFFEWVTALHRSLFLHEAGRLIVGITSFLLILIVLSGIGLIIQRQKGIRHFFSPIEKTNSAPYYHVVFGRIALLFILATAVTGCYLSVSRFIIKQQVIHASVNEDDIKDEPGRKLPDFGVFQQTKLSQVESIEFPFSDFPEDYYTLKLKDREVCVNQFTGDVLAQQAYPSSYILNNFSLRWHTGRSSAIWAIVMAITSGYILFFIYSGFVITWKRIGNKSKNKYKPGEARIVILVGSENGSTFKFANAIYKQLLKHNEKVYVTNPDNYTSYPNAEHIVVMTSTYGEGDPPSNARRFAGKLAKHPQQQQVSFSVIGFGSRSYVQFCKFAYDVDASLQQQPWANRLVDVVTVNDKSPQDFSNWLTQWTQQAGLSITMPRELLTPHQNLQKFTVTSKTDVDNDETFFVRFKAGRSVQVASGDLLAVFPKNDHRERLYSIGKINGDIQLSVKHYKNGLGSDYLDALQVGETINAAVIKNQHFHLPKKATQIVMISNGTGIAPFLGMIDENNRKVPCTLYCGFRTQLSFGSYEAFLSEAVSKNKLQQYQLALSREGEKQYVSHLISQVEAFIWKTISENGVIMICGSLSMLTDVMAVLKAICKARNADVERFVQRGQILSDCY